MLEIAGEKSPNLMLILNEKDKRSYIDHDDYFALKNGGPNLKKNIVNGTFGQQETKDGFIDLG
jgi:hypothetical protein